MTSTPADTFALFAAFAVLLGLFACRPKPTKEMFAGMNFPMKWKINREVHLPEDPHTNQPAEMFSVAGNYQSSLPPRFSNTQYRARIRCTGLPCGDNLPFDPEHPLSDRRAIDRVGEECCGAAPVVSRAPGNCVREAPEVGCGNGNAAPSDKLLHHALPVTDMRTIQCMAASQDAHNQDRIMAAAGQNANGSCKDAAFNPVVYDRLIYANARSRLKGGSDWIRGDLPIVPVLPECSPDSLVWGRPSVTPHLDLNQGAMHVLGGFDNNTQIALQDLMTASANGTLSTFSGIPLRNEAVTCNGSSDIIVSSFN